MPLISVITPVYNAEATLCQCVDSLLAQPFTDFELILVDDGSRDTSPRICDDYAALDSRIKVLHKHNGGVSSARNLGLQNARGPWVTFVDSDDWVDDDFFPALEQDVDIVFGSYRNVVDGAPFSTFDATVMCDLALGSLAQHFCADSILRCPWACKVSGRYESWRRYMLCISVSCALPVLCSSTPKHICGACHIAR